MSKEATVRSALKLALEALELINLEFVCANGSHHAKKDRHERDEDCPITDRWRKAITALREALNAPLAEQPAPATELREQEPVGWVDDGGTVFWKDKPPADGADLYTSPPVQRTWVGLTDAERETLRSEADEADAGYRELIKATEAKLKEKNT